MIIIHRHYKTIISPRLTGYGCPEIVGIAILTSIVVGAVPVGGMTGEILICSILGVDAGWVSDGEYLAAVQSEEYAKMPCWPEDGSIQMINGSVVVKLWEGPPLW